MQPATPQEEDFLPHSFNLAVAVPETDAQIAAALSVEEDRLAALQGPKHSSHVDQKTTLAFLARLRFRRALMQARAACA
jgi:hypothetical protein